MYDCGRRRWVSGKADEWRDMTMRLIDADRLREFFETESGDQSYKFIDLSTAFKFALRTIDKAPTIDPDVLRPQWIPVTERLPDNASHPGALCKRCMVMTKYGVTEGWYNPDRESWYVLFWFMTERIREYEIDFVSGDIPRVVKVPLHNGIVSAWMPLPEPYEPDGAKMKADWQ